MRPIPGCKAIFLASNSDFSDPEGRKLGTIHVLKDITETEARGGKNTANLVASVQEGVFISTLQGRFPRFQTLAIDAELSATKIATNFWESKSLRRCMWNPLDRRNGSKSFSNEHGSVNDFSNFEIRRQGWRNSATVTESSHGHFATRLETSRPIRGSLLDVTERRRAGAGDPAAEKSRIACAQLHRRDPGLLHRSSRLPAAHAFGRFSSCSTLMLLHFTCSNRNGLSLRRAAAGFGQSL